MPRALLLCCLAACAGRAIPPRAAPTCPPLDPLVGQVITLTGIQVHSKIPTVCGADVDGPEALADHQVEVTGRLQRTLVPADADLHQQTRTPGATTYQLLDPSTGALARPAPSDR
jgi:hypothetical protein